MRRVHQVVLIVSTLLGPWLGMQAVHLGPARAEIRPRIAYASALACVALLVLGLLVDGA